MKRDGVRRLAVLAASLSLLAPLGALADGDVAVLDWRRALMDTSAAQASFAQLRGRIGAQQREAETLGSELERLSGRLANEGGSLPEAEHRALMQEFQRKGQRFDGLRRDILEARQETEQRFLSALEPKMDRAVNQVIERRGIDVLVDPGGVLHSASDLPDVTAEVTQILNSL